MDGRALPGVEKWNTASLDASERTGLFPAPELGWLTLTFLGQAHL